MTVNLKASLLLILVPAWLALGCSSSSAPSTTPTTPSTSPKTVNFSSLLAPQGFVSHGFILDQAGTITVTLSTLSGPANLRVGFGLGVPASSVSSCSLTQSVTTGPGASISAAADKGTYCVALYDIGTLTNPVGFSVTIVQP